MTWRKGNASAANPAERINLLTCEGINGWEGTGRDTRSVPCQAVITGWQTAEAARAKARIEGWQTSRAIGDRCPLHRVTGRRGGRR